jgi:hypothetical protein
MRIGLLIILMLLLLLEKSKGQTPQLAGQYVFEIKKKMFSTYVFSSGNTFVSILSGDMGTFMVKETMALKKEN